MLEAGGKHPGDVLDIPATYFDEVMNFVKVYPSVPQENAGLLVNGVMQ